MAFEELKAKQSVIWGTGPYQNVTETITDHPRAVLDRLAPAAGVRWLDLACGTGAVAERAAEAAAQTSPGVDLAPALIETAKDRARERGLDIDYRVGDCENLEFEDGAFDVALLDVRSDVRAGPRGDAPGSWRGSSSPGAGSGSRTGLRREGPRSRSSGS